MTDVPISTLIHQIENHLQQDRPQQALSLGTHILYYYPMHLETYELLAQALVQQGNLNGALDVYHRVLSADPENPRAFAGVARIFERRRQLEEAVWHMERAFELAPVQPEVRQELLRLYGLYEAMPRERLKLTRGALARLYAQEGLYPQAIHEFREIGSTSLSRYDIRSALAQTLWHAGYTREAADAAFSLLDALPYCLKANLILGAAWHESGIAESQKYLERAVAIDPSNRVAQKLLGTRSPLRVTSVMVPDYVEGAPPPAYPEVKPQPEPAIPVLVPLEDGDTASIFEPEPTPAPEPALGMPKEPAADTIVTPPVPVIETLEEPTAETIETQAAATIETPAEPIAEAIPPPATTDEKPAEPFVETIAPPTTTYETLEEPIAEASVTPLPTIQAPAEPSIETSVTIPAAVAGMTQEPTTEKVETQTVATDQAPSESIAAESKLELPLAESVPETKPPASVADLPPWLIAADESIAESEVREDLLSQPSSTASSNPPWLAELRRAFSEETHDEGGVPAELIPVPTVPVEKPVVGEKKPEEVEPPQESSPLQPTAESKAETDDRVIPDWLVSQTATAEKEPEPDLPGWLKEPVPGVAESTPADASLVSRDELSASPAAEAPNLIEPAPTLGETGRTAGSRVPKWVEVLSRRELEEPMAKEATPARLEPAADVPQPEPRAQLESTLPRVESVEPKQTIISPEPTPPLAGFPEPAPPVSEQPSAQPAPAAEPELPGAMPMPGAMEAEIPAQPVLNPQTRQELRLAQAREYRVTARVPDALAEYESVINDAARLVSEAILDLEALVAKGDAPPDAHRLLGDAYTRVGRLNEALEQYRLVKRRTGSNPA